MGHAQLRDGDTVFFCRVAGVAEDEDRVLLHRSVHDDFWSLPGGHLEVGETAAEALRREMFEETHVGVTVGRLLWVIENFFNLYPRDRSPGPSQTIAHHEIGLYLAMEIPESLANMSSFMGGELRGNNDEFALEFQWFDRVDVVDVDVRPAMLKRLLSEPLPRGVPTIVSSG